MLKPKDNARLAAFHNKASSLCIETMTKGVAANGGDASHSQGLLQTVAAGVILCTVEANGQSKFIEAFTKALSDRVDKMRRNTGLTS